MEPDDVLEFYEKRATSSDESQKLLALVKLTYSLPTNEEVLIKCAKMTDYQFVDQCLRSGIPAQ